MDFYAFTYYSELTNTIQGFKTFIEAFVGIVYSPFPYFKWMQVLIISGFAVSGKKSIMCTGSSLLHLSLLDLG